MDTPACSGLTIDSSVITTKGLRTLQNLEIGDKVFNGSKFVCVLSKDKIMEKNVKKIHSNGYIGTTGDHKFPVYENGKWEDKKTDDLEIDHLLISPDKISLKEKDIDIRIKAKRLIKLKKNCADAITKALKDNFKYNKDLEKKTGLKIRQLRRIKNQGYPSDMNKIRSLVKYALKRDLFEDDYEIVNTNKHKNINIPKKINRPLLRLLGAWISDGYKDAKRSITIRDQEKQYLEYLSTLAYKEFKIQSSIKKIKDKNCYQLNINSKELLTVIRNIDLNELILLHENLILEFCCALYDGDGSLYKNMVVFSQMDFQLINILQMLLLRLGIQSYIRQEKRIARKWAKRRIYNLNALGSDKLKIVYGMKNIKKIRRFTGKGKGKKRTKHLIKDIKSVGRKRVVDITVEGGYFLCNGIITYDSTLNKAYGGMKNENE